MYFTSLTCLHSYLFFFALHLHLRKIVLHYLDCRRVDESAGLLDGTLSDSGRRNILRFDTDEGGSSTARRCNLQSVGSECGNHGARWHNMVEKHSGEPTRRWEVVREYVLDQMRLSRPTFD